MLTLGIIIVVLLAILGEVLLEHATRGSIYEKPGPSRQLSKAEEWEIHGGMECVPCGLFWDDNGNPIMEEDRPPAIQESAHQFLGLDRCRCQACLIQRASYLRKKADYNRHQLMENMNHSPTSKRL